MGKLSPREGQRLALGSRAQGPLPPRSLPTAPPWLHAPVPGCPAVSTSHLAPLSPMDAAEARACPEKAHHVRLPSSRQTVIGSAPSLHHGLRGVTLSAWEKGLRSALPPVSGQGRADLLP